MRIRAVVKRIVRQFKRDKRSLGLMMIAPILVLTLIWLVLGGDEYTPKITYHNVPETFINELDIHADMSEIASQEAAVKLMEEGRADAYVTFDSQKPEVLLEGSEPSINSSVMKALQEALKGVASGVIPEPEVNFLYGSSNLQLFDRIGPVLVGFFVFFFVFIIGGISFLRERTQGTLGKLLSTPIRRYELVTGYVIGFGIFTIIQSLVVLLFAVYVFDMYMVGQFWELLVVTILLAVTALTLATLLSAFAKTEFQIMQFIPIVIIPQVFFSGLFNLETLDQWIQVLSKFMPLTYGADALQQMMIQGRHITDVWVDILVLVGFSLVFYILNILVLKKHRAL